MKLQGNVTDLSLTESTDKKTAFKVDPALTMAMKFPEYECPVHGNIGTTGGVTFSLINRKTSTYCWLCIEDKLIAAGVCELTEVKK